MKYIGIRSTSAIPKNAVSQSLASEERVHGRVVQYWHVWVPDDDAVPPLFNEDAEPNKQKVRGLESWFKNTFGNEHVDLEQTD